MACLRTLYNFVLPSGCKLFCFTLISFLLTLFLSSNIFAQSPEITYCVPVQNSLAVPSNQLISVAFDTEMDETSFNDTTFIVHSSVTGLHRGILAYDDYLKFVLFDANDNFMAGEKVSVTLTTGIKSSLGINLNQPFCWTFTIATQPDFASSFVDSLYPISGEPVGIGNADLNNDGFCDIYLAQNNDLVSILINNGDGTFTTDSSYQTTGSLIPVSIVSSDFDNDDDIDLAVASGTAFTSDMTIFLNDGNGKFTDKNIYPEGTEYLFIGSGDLDGDGNIDLFTTDYYRDPGPPEVDRIHLKIFTGIGDGSFTYKGAYILADMWNPIPFMKALTVAVADFDNDGDLDLCTNNSDRLYLYKNNGDATFIGDSIYSFSGVLNSLQAADIDGDGNNDLVGAYYRSGSCYMMTLFNDGTGTFTIGAEYAAGSSPESNPKAIVTIDLDGDGSLDIITANSITEELSIFTNNGEGSFGAGQGYEIEGSPRSIFVSDLNNDGGVDLSVASSHIYISPDNISVHFNQPLHCCQGYVGNINCSVEEAPDISDISRLIDHLYLSHAPLCCFEEADCFPDEELDISDITKIIDHLYLSHNPLPDCP